MSYTDPKRDHCFSDLDQEIQSFYAENGKFPSAATNAQWTSWNNWLRVNHETSLARYLTKFGHTSTRTKGARTKPVLAIRLANGEQLPFPSVTAASKALGILPSSISMNLSGRQSATHGFNFRYQETA